MSTSTASPAAPEESTVPRPARDARLIVAQTAWIVFALLFTAIQVASQVAVFRGLANPDLTPLQIQALQGMGASKEFYAVWGFLSQLANPLVWGGLGVLVFLRRSNDRAALILSALMVGIAMATWIPGWNAFAAAYPQWIFLIVPGAFLGNFCIFSFFFLFPNGRYVPRWTVGLAIALSAYNVLDNYDFALPVALRIPREILDGLFPVFGVLTLAGFILAPLYRYKRVATRIEQQQIKWVVFTIVCAILFFAATAMTVFLLPGGNPDTDFTFITVFVQPIGWDGSLLLIPLSIGIAILRSHLWDIDIIVRRTLVYGALTVLLALTYFGSVVLLQQLFRAVSGQSSEMVIIISTLAIAALFVPLRRRVQNAIDLRFYRRKYDAAKVLDRFAQTARDEVELDKLTGELLNVVNETMQPTSMSVWLRAAPKQGDRLK